MAAKALNPEQCNILHPIYGVQNCCICIAKERIEELEREVRLLKEKIEIETPTN